MTRSKELRERLGLSVGWVARAARVTVGRVGAYERGEAEGREDKVYARLDKVYRAIEKLSRELAQSQDA